MTPDQIFDFLKQGGLLAAFILFVFACHKRWLVFGWQYKEKIVELEQTRVSQAHWQNIALRSTNLVETLSEINKSNLPPL